MNMLFIFAVGLFIISTGYMTFKGLTYKVRVPIVEVEKWSDGKWKLMLKQPEN